MTGRPVESRGVARPDAPGAVRLLETLEPAFDIVIKDGVRQDWSRELQDAMAAVARKADSLAGEISAATGSADALLDLKRKTTRDRARVRRVRQGAGRRDRDHARQERIGAPSRLSRPRGIPKMAPAWDDHA